jgi:hypothetical protein
LIPVDARRKRRARPKETSMKNLTSALFSAAAALGFAQAALTGNLVTNPGAETGDLSGWTTDGVIVTTSEAQSGDFSFTGATGGNPETMSQTIDLTAFASDIAAGGQTYVFSAFLQNRTFDFVDMQIRFLDADGNGVPLGASRTDPVIDPFAFDLVSIAGTLPVLARQVVLSFEFSRNSGASIDAYVDNVSFSLTDDTPSGEVPLPAALPLFGLGLAALGLKKKRRS